MDHKSKQIYDKIENFLEERKGRDRRTEAEKAEAAAAKAKAASDERRKKQDRRSSGN